LDRKFEAIKKVVRGGSAHFIPIPKEVRREMDFGDEVLLFKDGKDLLVTNPGVSPWPGGLYGEYKVVRRQSRISLYIPSKVIDEGIFTEGAEVSFRVEGEIPLLRIFRV